MSHPYYHALSSAARFGGVADDYVELHEWFDQAKAHCPDARHRAVLHSSFGIYLAQQCFGEVITRASDRRKIPVRLIGEQHVLEDLGYIPTLHEWLRCLQPQPWMTQNTRSLSRELSDGAPPPSRGGGTKAKQELAKSKKKIARKGATRRAAPRVKTRKR
ncbi:MAG: DUF6915 family protein [Betaproteobacteria bacterium]